MSPYSQQPTTINPSHLMNQFAYRFIRALNNLNNTKTTAAYDYNRRSRRVKIAAYAAMACVVGFRRAWSRALLWKIRNRSRNRGGFFIMQRKRKSRIGNKIANYSRHHAKVLSVKRSRNPNPKTKDHFDPLRKLRKLVPGAETMDSLSLMGETADYIKCLAAQVQVMKTLVDRYTTT